MHESETIVLGFLDEIKYDGPDKLALTTKTHCLEINTYRDENGNLRIDSVTRSARIPTPAEIRRRSYAGTLTEPVCPSEQTFFYLRNDCRYLKLFYFHRSIRNHFAEIYGRYGAEGILNRVSAQVSDNGRLRSSPDYVTGRMTTVSNGRLIVSQYSDQDHETLADDKRCAKIDFLKTDRLVMVIITPKSDNTAKFTFTLPTNDKPMQVILEEILNEFRSL